MKLIYLILITISLLFCCAVGKKSDPENKPKWAQKDIRDFSDSDMERLLDQWEEDEDPLEPDELPEHLRAPPQIDMSKFNSNNPEDILKLSKKGRTLMTFVTISGSPTKEESETITKLWQTSLWNNHIQAERYIVDDNRALFVFKDGSQAWEAKDFLIEQEHCASVSIENKVYDGKYKSTNKDEL